MRSSSYVEQRLAQLAQNIQENLELLKAYERRRRLSKEPREQQEWDDQIADVKKLLEKDTKEKEALENGGNVQVAVSEIQPHPVSARRATESDNKLQDHLMEIKDEMKRGFDDLKRGQGVIYQLLTETRNQELKAVVSLVRQGGIQQEEMIQMLEMVRQTLSTLENNQKNLSREVKEAITDTSSALNSETSLQGKLELTLPIIPLLLDYKVELAMTDSVDLNRLWENTQKWWKSLTARTSRQTTQALINEYSEKFKVKDSYLSEFESKINQSVSNINILIRADEALTDLAKLLRSFMNEIKGLGVKIDYPKDDFERIGELATSIATESRSAAASVATGGNPTQQINQIRRNMPVLRKTMLQLVLWFQQLTAQFNQD